MNAMRALAHRGFPLALPRLSGRSRVWALTLALAAGAAVVYAFGVVPLAPVRAPIRLEWWMLAAGFAVVEIFVIQLQFRRDTHSFSLSEIPLVLGFFFVAPHELLLAQFVGAGAALWLHRRQPFIKLAFNLSNLTFSAACALVLFHLVVGPNDPHGQAGWIGAFSAAITADLFSLVMITVAIALSSGQSPELRQLFGAGTVATFFNTSLALVAVTVLWTYPQAAWLLLILAGMLFLAYRAYASLRRSHERLELMYESSRNVQRSLEAESVGTTLLSHAREMFHAELAEVLVFANGTDGARLSSQDSEGHTRLMESVELDPTEGVWARVASEGRGVCLPRPITSPRLREHFDARGMRDVMVVPLHGPDGIVGTMLVANRIGDVATFTQDDLRLFETLANHASISFRNGQLVDRLRHQAAESEYQALHDPLTGLGNRTLFRSRLAMTLAARLRTGAPCAVMVMDLDRFKEVNDTLGHGNGDELLQKIALRLSERLGHQELLARLGGDEFAIVLPHADRAAAVRVAESLIEALQQPFIQQELTLEVSASIGIAVFPEHGRDAETLIQRADMSMYLAKSHHTGYEIYSAERDESSPMRLGLVGELRRGIDEGELVVLYQPKADLRTGKIVGAEALVRWQHPRHGLMLPDDFIPMAEQAGLLRPLTLHVLEAAIGQCATWRRAGFEMGVAVNLSVRNLLDLELPDDVARLLARFSVPARCLQLEITESTIMADLGRTQGVLRRLHGIGTDIAIDDFGTGYSSLSQLKRLLVDELKIDKSFVIGMAADEDDRLIVRSTIDLGRNLGLRVVAEGVETREVWEELRSMGCHVAQGHYVSRPVTGSQLSQLLLDTPLREQSRPDPSAGSARYAGIRVATRGGIRTEPDEGERTLELLRTS